MTDEPTKTTVQTRLMRGDRSKMIWTAILVTTYYGVATVKITFASSSCSMFNRLGVEFKRRQG